MMDLQKIADEIASALSQKWPDAVAASGMGLKIGDKVPEGRLLRQFHVEVDRKNPDVSATAEIIDTLVSMDPMPLRLIGELVTPSAFRGVLGKSGAIVLRVIDHPGFCGPRVDILMGRLSVE